MIRTIRLLILLTIALTATQCGRHHYPPKLTLLDSLAEAQVDSAVVLMRRIAPQMDDASEWDRRYYQLLSVKVADRADLPMPSDTAAWEMVRYYEEEGDERLLPTAYYYGARICRSHNDAPQALDYLLKANDLLTNTPPEDESQLHLKAVVNSQMGYLFSQQKLYSNAIEAFKEAYRCDSINKDTTGLIYNLRDIGNYTNNETTIQYYKESLNLAKQHNDIDLVADLSSQIANFYIKRNVLDSAKAYIKVALDFNDPEDRKSVYAIAAKIYDKTQQKDSAITFYKKLTNLQSVYSKERGYEGLYKYAYCDRQLDTAFAYFKHYKNYYDSIQNITSIETVAEINAIHNYQHRERENVQLKEDIARRDRNALIASILIIIIIASFTIAYYRMRGRSIQLKANLEELERSLHEASIKSEQQIAKNISTIKELEEQIVNLGNKDQLQKEELIILKKKIEHQTELAIIAQKEEKNAVSQLKDTVIGKYIEDANSMDKEDIKCLTEVEWAELSNAFDNIFPDFKKKLYNICPLKLHEYHLCMLIKLNISPGIMGVLTAHSKESVTSTRRRLYQKSFGKKGSPKDWDDFVLSI